jgi:ferredoxin
MIRIDHYRDKCIGCNACVEASFSRWRMSRKDGKSVLIGAARKKGCDSLTVGDEEKAENARASKNCPVRIIQIIQL